VPDPNGFDLFRAGEPFPALAGAPATSGFDLFRAGEILPALLSSVATHTGFALIEREGEDIIAALRSAAKLVSTEAEGEDTSARLHYPSTLESENAEGEDIVARLTRAVSARIAESEGERIHVALRTYPPVPGTGVRARPLVRLIWTAEIETDLPVTSLSWTAATARQDGAAEIAVPPTSDALSNLYIRPGRSAVVITDSVLGVWRGRLMRAGRQNNGGATLQAVHVTALFKQVKVHSGTEFTSVPAGIVARAAIRDAAAQLGQVLLRAGSFVEAPPLVTYELNNKPLDQVLSELMDRSGQEWVYNDEGVFSWVAQAGRYIGRLFAHDGDIIVESGDEDGTNMLDSVSTRTPDGTLLTARVEV
jgi:hypothetical protein